MAAVFRRHVLARAGRRLVAGFAALVALYAVLGFLVLPAILVRQIPARLGRMLHREVSLTRVRVNPFALSVSLEGFRVKDRDGADFLAWDRLYVNARYSTLFTRTVGFKAIEWINPRGRVVIAGDGTPNFADILDRFATPEASRTPESGAPGRELAIGRFTIRGLRLTFLDRSPKEPFATTVGPVDLELGAFRTRRDQRSPYAFSGRTEAGESFAWSGTFGAEPLQSQGEFSLDGLDLPRYQPYFRDRVAFDLARGRLSLRAHYQFEWSGERHTLKLRQGRLELRDLALRPRNAAAPALELPLAQATDLELDALENALDVGQATVQGLRTSLTRRGDGSLDLVELLTPKPSPEKEPTKPFHLVLHGMSCRDFRIAFEDRATPRPVRAALRLQALELKDFTLDPGCEARLALDLLLDERGRLRAEGLVKPFKPAADLTLKLESLALPPLDPYLEPALALRLSQGRLSAEGRLQGAFPTGAAASLRFQGSVGLEDFEAMDALRREHFLRYRSLRLEGLDVRTTPGELRIRDVRLVGPVSRLVLDGDGSTNVARALKLESASSSPAASAAPPTPGKPFKVGIARIQIEKGELAYIDRSVSPNAAFTISDLHGAYRGLSTEPESQAAVELHGLAGGLAPLLIQGRAMPLRHDQDTDITVKLQGAELSDFGPYAGKYLGYAIRKGKLDASAALKIRRRQLNAKVDARLDQFFLGDRVPSPDATHLPVKLALALLRDRRGVIDLELPMDGSLDAPDFHYGAILWHALLNVLTKAAASPFDLLARTFGGGDQDLSFLAFQPGTAEPDAGSPQKLAVLARSLQERPDLNLEVEGWADAADTAALKQRALEKLLRETKLQVLCADAPGRETPEADVAPAERERWLTAAFERAFPPPGKPSKREQRTPPPPPAEMEQRLLATFEVDAGQLRALARARARTVAQRLAAEGQLDAARIFEVEGGERARREGGSRAYFSLR